MQTVNEALRAREAQAGWSTGEKRGLSTHLLVNVFERMNLLARFSVGIDFNGALLGQNREPLLCSWLQKRLYWERFPSAPGRPER